MYVLFDIGGTKTRVAVAESTDAFGEMKKIDTPKTFEEGIEVMCAIVDELRAGNEITEVAVGIAGPLAPDHGELVLSPNLPNWAGKPFRRTLSERLLVPEDSVLVENDSAMVALGEAHFGAGKGDDIMAYITVSTGVGGARIVDGHIDRSTFGFEPGHQILDMDGTVCRAFESFEAEDMLSGTATALRFGKKAYEVTDPEVWDELSKWLAYMLNNTIVHWSPRSVVLGGSMIVGEPAIPVDKVDAELAKLLHIFPQRPFLKKATLEDKGGLYGGLARIAQKVHK